jgi:CheY-like chemotaxis protein
MKKILITRDIKPLVATALEFLQRSDVSVTTTTTNDDILRHHIAEKANLIITQLEAPGLSCETLIHTVRRGESLRKVSVILIYDGTAGQQERCRRCGANVVISRPVNPVLFAGKVRDLLDVAPRKPYRVVLNFAVEGANGNRPFLCSSQNISTTGILIKTKESLWQGERVACSFYLPDGTHWSAAGEIVRSVRRPDETGDGHYYGIKFETLAPNAEAAIAAFVNKDSWSCLAKAS